MPSQDWFDATHRPANWAAGKSERRSHTTVNRIMDKPADITLLRGLNMVSEQTVRIETRAGVQRVGTMENGNAVTYARAATVFGVRDHPSLPDLDIQIGDRFGYNDDNYIVTEITRHAGEIQAICDRYQP